MKISGCKLTLPMLPKGGKAEPSRPNSHDLKYGQGEYQYIDTYLGGEKFSGEEAVWYQNTPVWSMNYQGRILGNGFSGDFLKEAFTEEV